MARLQAFPQTEREAQQIYTIAHVVLFLGYLRDVDGVITASVTLPHKTIAKYAGKNVTLYLEEGDEEETLIVEVTESEPVIIEESE